MLPKTLKNIFLASIAGGASVAILSPGSTQETHFPECSEAELSSTYRQSSPSDAGGIMRIKQANGDLCTVQLVAKL
jgi:hypothetical protein